MPYCMQLFTGDPKKSYSENFLEIHRKTLTHNRDQSHMFFYKLREVLWTSLFIELPRTTAFDIGRIQNRHFCVTVPYLIIILQLRRVGNLSLFSLFELEVIFRSNSYTNRLKQRRFFSNIGDCFPTPSLPPLQLGWRKFQKGSLLKFQSVFLYLILWNVDYVDFGFAGSHGEGEKRFAPVLKFYETMFIRQCHSHGYVTCKVMRFLQ